MRFLVAIFLFPFYYGDPPEGRSDDNKWRRTTPEPLKHKSDSYHEGGVYINCFVYNIAENHG